MVGISGSHKELRGLGIRWNPAQQTRLSRGVGALSRMYSHIKLASKLSSGCDYAMFKVSFVFTPSIPQKEKSRIFPSFCRHPPSKERCWGAGATNSPFQGRGVISDWRGCSTEAQTKHVRPELHLGEHLSLEGLGERKESRFLAWLLNIPHRCPALSWRC